MLQLYPSMLITAYSEDSRVPLAGVLKYVEKLKKAIQTHTSKLDVNGQSTASLKMVALFLIHTITRFIRARNSHWNELLVPERFNFGLSEVS